MSDSKLKMNRKKLRLRKSEQARKAEVTNEIPNLSRQFYYVLSIAALWIRNVERSAEANSDEIIGEVEESNVSTVPRLCLCEFEMNFFPRWEYALIYS